MNRLVKHCKRGATQPSRLWIRYVFLEHHSILDIPYFTHGIVCISLSLVSVFFQHRFLGHVQYRVSQTKKLDYLPRYDPTTAGFVFDSSGTSKESVLLVIAVLALLNLEGIMPSEAGR